MRLRQTPIFTVTFIALALGPFNRMQAQLVAYDGFEYASPTNPAVVSTQGTNGGFGWGQPPGANIWLATNGTSGVISTNRAGDPLKADGGSAAATNDVPTSRGKYLVENVAMCATCHSPKTDKGDYDRTQWLQGDVLDIKPDHLMPFASVAPPIAGMPGFTDAQALKFLETGIDVTGKPAMYPMPQYRFSHEDALAVLAYLRSLKP